MFRKMRRFKQELTKEDCMELLKVQPRGILAIHGEDGYPYAFPMDFIYMNDKIYFHSAKAGHKADALQADNRVSFCVMDEGFRKDGEWSLNIKSVVIFGRIEKSVNPEINKEILVALGLKYNPSIEDVYQEIRRDFAKVEILELTIDHMTGKLVNES